MSSWISCRASKNLHNEPSIKMSQKQRQQRITHALQNWIESFPFPNYGFHYKCGSWWVRSPFGSSTIEQLRKLHSLRAAYRIVLYVVGDKFEFICALIRDCKWVGSSWNQLQVRTSKWSKNLGLRSCSFWVTSSAMHFKRGYGSNQMQQQPKQALKIDLQKLTFFPFRYPKW